MGSIAQADAIVRMAKDNARRTGGSFTPADETRLRTQVLGMGYSAITRMMDEYGKEWAPTITANQIEFLEALAVQIERAGTKWEPEVTETTTIPEASALIAEGKAVLQNARKAKRISAQADWSKVSDERWTAASDEEHRARLADLQWNKDNGVAPSVSMRKWPEFREVFGEVAS